MARMASPPRPAAGYGGRRAFRPSSPSSTSVGLREPLRRPGSWPQQLPYSKRVPPPSLKVSAPSILFPYQRRSMPG
eukprot:15448241-Alexandrium_andersonii.AAC.1